jgi:hypothetical protein
MGGAILCRIFDVIRKNAPGILPVRLAPITPTVTMTMVGYLASVRHARLSLVANAMTILSVLE